MKLHGCSNLLLLLCVLDDDRVFMRIQDWSLRYLFVYRCLYVCLCEQAVSPIIDPSLVYFFVNIQAWMTSDSYAKGTCSASL
jgi:hypothetical protein